MPDLIVVGYPKSGNTWITRLVGELLGAPVLGFHGGNRDDEPAIEGLERASKYRVYKAHHTLASLQPAPPDEPRRLIHVVRNPLDIAVSGAHFFRTFPGRSLISPRLFGRPGKTIRKALGLAYWKLARLQPARPLQDLGVRSMIRALKFGDPTLAWCQHPWNEYELEFLDAKVFTVRYEDMRSDPESECRRILDYLGESRSHEHIRCSIELQSFHRRKAVDPTDRTVRKGEVASWRNHLSNRDALATIRALEPAFSLLGYATVDGE